MASLEVKVEAFPTYLHVIGFGERSPDTVTEFFRRALAACKEGGHTRLLFESHLAGPSIGDTTLLYQAVAGAIPDLRGLQKFAYVPGPGQDRHYSWFAETVARNRGVEARVFEDAAAAAEWLSS